MTLHARVERAITRHGDRTAIEDVRGRALTYSELGALSDRLRDRLHRLGVRAGDRVGVHLAKSIDAVAAIVGVLKTGAAYVPVDSEAPVERAAYILRDCAVSAIVSEAPLAAGLETVVARNGTGPPLLALRPDDRRLPLEALLDREDDTDPADPVATADPGEDALAYILYTSGSTGRPKGVMHTHRGALSFVDWCSRTFAPSASDRFSSHSPFHFDLSILDLYVSLGCGATLVLIGEAAGRDPRALSPLIEEKRITVWYSVPSILNLLAQYGRLERHDHGTLRLVLFAGEVFPVPQLRALQAHWPHPQYFNLYGPTETNVCTYHGVPGTIDEGRVEPLPIGPACDHLRCRVVDPAGRTVPRGAEGELIVNGPAVMAGYWNLPEQDAAAFLVDREGERWYRTGDVVVEDAREGYLFHGRRDRMVKRRGYRIELGEIEATLARHPSIREVAVVAIPDGEAGVRITAVLSTKDGGRLSIIDLKQFSVDHLPRYMVPDTFRIVSALPRTATDKIDYRAIAERG